MSSTRKTTHRLTRFATTRPAVALWATLGLTALAGCGSSDPSTVAAPPGASSTADPMPSSTSMSGHDMGGMGAGGHMADPGKGLLASEKGLTLKPASTTVKPGAQTLGFQVLDASGQPQTDYAVDATKLLHFYLVRQDLTGFQHLHPTLSNGTWSIAVDALTPGPYRMYTDFVAKDSKGTETPAVLSTPLTVTGAYTATALPATASSATADGLTATMTGTIAAGTESKVSFQITENGKPVTDLETYLDSFAHMTALNASTLAYQHIHPGLTATPGQKGGPTLPFEVDLPEKGTYRLFLQVQRAGTLHLLPLTVTVT
jgi:hypothetical protein